MTDHSPFAVPADTWQETLDEKAGCRIFQRGRHCEGTFVRVYVPDQVDGSCPPPPVIVYLHGFALCVPAF